MSTEGTQPEEDLDRLKKRKERAELKAQIAALTTPWWRKASLITVVTALVAAVLPVTKVIEEHYRNRRELALEEAKELNELRVDYLERYNVPGHRLRTLRFLIATTDDPRLRAWAEAEQAIVQAELDPIEHEIRVVTERIAQATDPGELEELRRRLEALHQAKLLKTLRPPTLAPGRDPSPEADPGPGSAR